MERLSYVFQHHPSAIRIHRELTVALANGDAARAADLAGVLAATVQRVVTAETPIADDSSCVNVGASPTRETSADGAAHAAATKGTDQIPAPTANDIEEAMERTRAAVLRHTGRPPVPGNAQQRENGAEESQTGKERPLPFWRDSQYLCVTVLESAFETDVPEGEAQDSLTASGNRAAEHEAEQMRILETYLEKEGTRWKAQKAAIAKIVLDVAKAVGITPEDLQVAEGLTSGRQVLQEEREASVSSANNVNGSRLNVLRHSNLVIRGEIPSAAHPPSSSTDSTAAGDRSDVDAQLAALEERMRSLGTPLTHEESQMARYELWMSQSKMRYVVGVHKELQAALDSSEAVKEVLRKRAGAAASLPSSVTATQLFMDEVLRALNEGAEAFTARLTGDAEPLSVEDVAAREAAENPVLPFTFMLKCCLWFNTTPPF
jgi:hypothetical protein